MKITEALVAEHQSLYPMLDSIEKAAETASLEQMKAHAERLYNVFRSHGAVEHELLFADFLGRPAEHQQPVAAMRNEHDAIEDALTRMAKMVDTERARLLLQHIVQMSRDHMEREERIYFKRARQVLGDAKLEQLGREYLKRRAREASGGAGK